MTKGVIYFIGGAGRIKVGHTVDVTTRFATLQTANADELVIIAAVDAPRTAERAILTLLAPLNIRGEWFRDCPELRAVIERVRRGEFEVVIESVPPRLVDRPDVLWAADALRKVSEPRLPDETTKEMIERVAARLDMKYSRTFEIWYRKARRLEISERDAIQSVLGVCNGTVASAA